jgi:hypothetical protein
MIGRILPASPIINRVRIVAERAEVGLQFRLRHHSEAVYRLTR